MRRRIIGRDRSFELLIGLFEKRDRTRPMAAVIALIAFERVGCRVLLEVRARRFGPRRATSQRRLWRFLPRVGGSCDTEP